MKHLTSQGSPLPPKLYCLTMLNDELDLLELRFREQESVVDTWVISEAGQTHAGGSKPLHLTESLEREPERWARWRDRIRVVTIPRFHYSSDPWVRERYQRDSGLRALGWADGHDFVLVEDCDEIASAAAIRRAVEGPTPCRFALRFCYFHLDTVRTQDWTQGSSMARRCQVLGLSILRAFPNQRIIPNGGLHFSFAGGVQRIIKKLKDYAHGEYDMPGWLDSERIATCIRERRDLFGRHDHHWVKAPDESHIPAWVKENRERFKHWFLETDPAMNGHARAPEPVESGPSPLVGVP